MRLHVVEPSHAHFEADSCLVIPVYEEDEANFGGIATDTDRGTLRGLQLGKQITGKAQETYYFPTPNSAYGGILIVGMGQPNHFNAEVLRRAAGKACAVLCANRHGHVVLDAASRDAIPVEAFVEGVMLGQYDFNPYKKPETAPTVKVDEITVLAQSEAGLEDLRTGCAHTVLACQNANWARDLANTPPNDLTPQALAAQAQAMAKQIGCDCAIFDENDLREHEMRGILAVAQGSAEPPRLILLEYKPENPQRTVALVGKGVTFDTGGVSIKSGPGMHEMKYDMCGAAAVLGAMKTIVQLKAPVHMICAVPTADNKTGPAAYVPGDIIRMFNGKTVEVHNTDAEGRMLLADTLAYVEKTYRPDAIVDVMGEEYMLYAYPGDVLSFPQQVAFEAFVRRGGGWVTSGASGARTGAFTSCCTPSFATIANGSCRPGPTGGPTATGRGCGSTVGRWRTVNWFGWPPGCIRWSSTRPSWARTPINPRASPNTPSATTGGTGRPGVRPRRRRPAPAR